MQGYTADHRRRASVSILILVGAILSLAPSASAQYSAYVGTGNGILFFENGGISAEVQTLPTPGDIAVTTDGALLFTSFETRRGAPALAVIDTVRRSVLQTISTGDQVGGIATRPGTHVAYVAFPADTFGESRIGVLDPELRGLRSLFFGGARVERPTVLAFEADGAVLWVGSRTMANRAAIGRVDKINPDTGKLLGTLEIPTGVIALSVSDDGARVYVGAHEVLVLDGESLAILHRVAINAETMAITHDGRRVFFADNSSFIASGSSTSTVKLHVLDTRTFELAEVPISGAYITDMALTADDTILYTAHSDGRTNVIRIDTPYPDVTSSEEAGSRSVAVAPTSSMSFVPVDPEVAVVRIASAQGQVSDLVSVPITLRNGTATVGRIDHELRSTGGAPFNRQSGDPPDCTINRAAGIAGTIEFLPPHCQYCDRLVAHLTLPSSGAREEVELYSCNLRFNPYDARSFPIASGQVAAWDGSGAQTPALALDSDLIILRGQQTVSNPTLTPTATTQASAAQTATPSPAATASPTFTAQPTITPTNSDSSGCALSVGRTWTFPGIVIALLPLLAISVRRPRAASRHAA